MSVSRSFRRIAMPCLIVSSCLFVALPGRAAPQNDDSSAGTRNNSTKTDSTKADKDDESAVPPGVFETVTVTATASEVDTLEVAPPVGVVSRERIEELQPDNPADLMRGLPGVDVNGVGSNQPRPIIRGQRGLRVLFMENGLRLNNPRRQTDFGEIAGLVDLDAIDAVEVLRGPASVLYGSDAVGGVLNLVTDRPEIEEGIRGSLSFRYSDADDQFRTHLGVAGRSGKLSYRLGLTRRKTDDYEAASGRYGEIRLDADTPVVDTGVRDDDFNGWLSWEANDRHEFSLAVNRYRAERTGFGYVEPELFGGDTDFQIRILYPYQDFDRITLGHDGTNLNRAWADSVELRLYYQNNERELVNDIGINIGPTVPGVPGLPDSFVQSDTLNFTDVDTFGARAELIKVAGERHLLTYGFDFTQDDSFNTDSSTTTSILFFPGPPIPMIVVESDTLANAPNAKHTSIGAFLQDEIRATDRLKLTVGARFQNVATEAEATPGWDVTGLDFDDDNLVGAASALYRVTDNLRVVGSYGTAFRAPNVIERLFNGPTPEGIGYQLLNSDLVSERSRTFDIGFKYRSERAFAEWFYFDTEIDDGIVQDFLSPDEIMALPADVQADIASQGPNIAVVQQRNIDRLSYDGIELEGGYQFRNGIRVSGNYTHINGERVGQSAVPVEDSFSDKYNLVVGYRPQGDRYWLEYRLRRNGEERTRVDPNEPLPAIGPVLPAFTVHTAAGGVTFGRSEGLRHHLGLTIENLSDKLYAEFSNASFFRPQPKRRVIATYRLTY